MQGEESEESRLDCEEALRIGCDHGWRRLVEMGLEMELPIDVPKNGPFRSTPSLSPPSENPSGELRLPQGPTDFYMKRVFTLHRQN